LTTVLLALAVFCLANAVANVALARFLLLQSRLLAQTGITLNAAINCLTRLVEQLGVAGK